MKLLTTKNLLVALMFGGAGFNPVARAALAITSFNSPVAQDFDSLANSGESSLLPSDWHASENGAGGATYAAGTGSSQTGNTYSFGAAGLTDRALGSLSSGSLLPSFGVQLQNKTGSTIESLRISYIGEQWRMGAATADKLVFEYSFNATSLTTGNWNVASALDFVAPSTGSVGSRDGNSAINRTTISSFLTLTLVNDGFLWLRWTDFDVTGTDHGLAIDDFSITAPAAAVAAVPEPSTFLAGLLLGLPFGVRGIRYLQNRH